MKAASVSVVIPCFNCQTTISETLESIASQTSPPKEVILVDDGSSDGTWELLHELKATRYPGLLLLAHQDRQNHGASMARYLGVAHATGDYIAFLDADDQFVPTKLERQLTAFERYPEIVMCHTGVRVIGDLNQADFYEAAFSGSPEIPYWFRRQQDYLIRNRICISSSMVLAKTLRQVPFSFVGKLGVEDWLCWCLLAAKGRFLYLPEQLTRYRVHPDSITSRLTQSSRRAKSVAVLSEVSIRKLYGNLEFKLVLFARSESSLHGLRVLGSIGEDLRRIVIFYLWNPCADPNSSATIRPNALVRALMLPFRLARGIAACFGLPWFRR